MENKIKYINESNNAEQNNTWIIHSLNTTQSKRERKLGWMANTPEGCAAFQKDLNRLERSAERGVWREPSEIQQKQVQGSTDEE